MTGQKPPKDALARAAKPTLERIAEKTKPDELDNHETRSLRKEQSAANLVDARADSIRTDNGLRKLTTISIVVLLFIVVIYAIVMSGLRSLGILADDSLVKTLIAPGGIGLALIAALVIVLKRPPK